MTAGRGCMLATPAVAASLAPLTWAPPTGWQTYTPLILTDSVDGSVKIYTLDDSTDYRVVAGVLTTATVLRGGRNIVWVGAEINITDKGSAGTLDPDRRRALLVQDTDPNTQVDGRIIHIEGIYIHGVDLADAINIDAPKAIVQIQAYRAENVHFRTGFDRDYETHPDIIQTYGSQKELRVDKLSGTTAYQGLFLKEDHTDRVLGPMYFKRVNLTAIGTDPARPNGDGFTYYGHRVFFMDPTLTGSAFLDPGTVWAKGSTFNGWYRAVPNPRSGSNGYYWTRYDTGSLTAPSWAAAALLNGFETTSENWIEGNGGTPTRTTANTFNSTAGALTFSKAFAASGFDAFQLLSDLRATKNISGSGSAISIRVKATAIPTGKTVTARIQTRHTDFSSSNSSQSVALVSGSYVQVTATDLNLTDIARVGVQIEGSSVNGTVTVVIDQVEVGTLTAGSPIYATDTTHPGGAPDSDTIGENAPTSTGTDSIGPWAQMDTAKVRTWDNSAAGKVYLGVPPGGDYVPAGVAGLAYVSPGYL